MVCATFECVLRCNELAHGWVSLFPVFIKMMFMKCLCVFSEVVKMINLIKGKSALNNHHVARVQSNGK